MNRILVAGAGALGSFLAARFLGCGKDVRLIAREPRLTSLRKEGIALEFDGSVTSIPVSVSASCGDIDSPELIILASKHGDLIPLLQEARKCAGPDTIFMTVQNGVEAPAVVAREFPASAVIASRVHGFFELEDGVVRHVGVEPSITFGQTHCSPSKAETKLAQLLSAANIKHTVARNIEVELWEKLLLAASVGGVGTAYSYTAGAIMRDDQAKRTLGAAMKEVHALAQRRSIPLPADCVEANLAFVADFPFDATTSMQRDLEASLPSEYDCLVGAVLRLADESDISVPTFHQIDTMIRARGLLP